MIIDHLSKGLQIDLSRRAVRVDSSQAGSGRGVSVTVERSGGHAETLTARAVVVAVPLSILQDGDIAFVPPLPVALTAAFATIGWQRHGVKILCARGHCATPVSGGSGGRSCKNAGARTEREARAPSPDSPHRVIVPILLRQSALFEKIVERGGPGRHHLRRRRVPGAPTPPALKLHAQAGAGGSREAKAA